MKLTGAWLLGAFVAIAFSWGAVAQVRNRVIEPSIEIPATVVAAPGGNTGTPATTSTTVIRVEPDIDDGATASTSTTAQPAETTTTTQPVTTTSQPMPTTTTTTSPAETKTSSYQLVGGVVTISHSPGVVVFVSAIPQPGFTTNLEETGPKSVRVRFEGEAHTSEFRAEWEDGELDITRNEGDDD
jgi:hypothetical protein